MYQISYIVTSVIIFHFSIFPTFMVITFEFGSVRDYIFDDYMLILINNIPH